MDGSGRPGHGKCKNTHLLRRPGQIPKWQQRLGLWAKKRKSCGENDWCAAGGTRHDSLLADGAARSHASSSLVPPTRCPGSLTGLAHGDEAEAINRVRNAFACFAWIENIVNCVLALFTALLVSKTPTIVYRDETQRVRMSGSSADFCARSRPF